MWRAALFIVLLFSGAWVVGCLSSENVLLGSNVDVAIATQGSLPDATAPDAGASDAPSALCLLNPNFHGNPTTLPGMTPRMSLPLLHWTTCGGNVDVNPSIVCSLPAPPESTTYYGLPVGYAAFQHAIWTSVSTPLPTEIAPGNYPFTIELGVAVSTLPHNGFGIVGGAPVELVFYGSSSSACGQDEPLARIQLSGNADSWATYASVLTATRPFSNLVLVPTLTAPDSPGHAGAYVVVANFKSATCN